VSVVSKVATDRYDVYRNFSNRGHSRTRLAADLCGIGGRKGGRFDNKLHFQVSGDHLCERGFRSRGEARAGGDRCRCLPPAPPRPCLSSPPLQSASSSSPVRLDLIPLTHLLAAVELLEREEAEIAAGSPPEPEPPATRPAPLVPTSQPLASPSPARIGFRGERGR
jgi:hypothetical protein